MSILKVIWKIILRLIGWSVSIFILITLGWRGIVGALIGMLIIIVMLVTQNTLFLAIIELMGGSKQYNETLIRGYPDEEKTKKDN